MLSMIIEHVSFKNNRFRPVYVLRLDKEEPESQRAGLTELKAILDLAYPFVSFEGLPFTPSEAKVQPHKPYYNELSDIPPHQYFYKYFYRTAKMWTTNHNYTLLKNIPSSAYAFRGLEWVSVAINQKHVPRLLDKVWTPSANISGTCLKDKYLDSKMWQTVQEALEKKKPWQWAFIRLNHLDWNLHFTSNLQEGSFFASPDPFMIECVIMVLGLEQVKPRKIEVLI